MRPIGIHLSYWQTEWAQDVLPFIERARDAGFDGVEFPMLQPETMDLAALKEELDANGLRATCGTGLNLTTDITHPDPSVRRAGIAHLQACLEGAAALGSPVLGGVTYAPWSYFPPGDPRPYRQRCVESLREAGKIADDVGVTLCLEVLNRFEGYLLNTVQQGLGLLAEVNSPHLKLHVDTFHLNIEEQDIAEAIRAAGAQLGHFHCSENNRQRPGTGHIPWTAIGLALNEIGYTGWIVMESFVRPAGEVGRTLSIWRPLAEDLDAEARAGADFLRRWLAGVSPIAKSDV
jgi:D-psicose/D-tagatose/L-ribulose 3-epimerase